MRTRPDPEPPEPDPYDRFEVRHEPFKGNFLDRLVQGRLIFCVIDHDHEPAPEGADPGLQMVPHGAPPGQEALTPSWNRGKDAGKVILEGRAHKPDDIWPDALRAMDMVLEGPPKTRRATRVKGSKVRRYVQARADRH